jgi:4-aminobutyrate aminotransferase
MGDYFQDILHELMVRHPNIGEVRGKGLMIGVEFVQDRQTKVAAEKLRDRVVDLAFSTGLLTLGCGKSVIRFAPPLSISRSEIDEGIEIFERALMIAEKEPE